METFLTILKNIGIILAVIFSFNVIIFVHELGHFLAARWRGLEVERFQIWFGKPIWKKTINGVQYGLGSIPAGGFVALPQMAPMESIEGDNLERKNPLPPISPLDKIIVAFAGPLFSFLLALAAAVTIWQIGKPNDFLETQTVGYVATEMPAAKAGLKEGDEIIKINGDKVHGFGGSLDSIMERIVFSTGDKITLTINRPGIGEMEVVTGFHVEEASNFTKRDGVRQIGILPASTVIVENLFKGGPAEFSGFKVNDKILSVDGETIYSVGRFQNLIAESGDKLLNVVVLRGSEEITLQTKPLVPSNGYRNNPAKDPTPMIGMGFKSPYKTGLVYPGPWEQITATGRMMVTTISALTSSDSSIGVEQLSGPVGIGKVQFHILQGEYPIRQLLYFWVLFNVNLAIFNLLPFPVLDGGHITMATMEWIRKKPLNTKVLEVVQTAFVALLLTMFVYVTMKDSFTSFVRSAPEREEGGPSKPEWSEQDLQKALKPSA
ncbi:MAG: RIP metalloprotease RseP [Rubritalea sp.]|uniref:RIP metalloprotease RseP n=1 Tax=Rubritalea sp. TaxID=2109375 RepID=UPI003241F41C